MRINVKALYALFLIFILTVCSIVLGVEPLFTAVLAVWLFLIFYAYSNMKDRSMLFAFLIAFFVFLLGRDFVQQFLGYKVENFPDEVQRHAYVSYLITLISIGIFYRLFAGDGKKASIKKAEYSGKQEKVLLIRQLSLYIYYFSWVFAVISKLVVGSFVAARGFTDYYTDYPAYLSDNTIFYLVSKIELIMPAAWCIFLATRPSRKQLKWPLIFYTAYLVVSLGSGQRSTSMLGILFLFVYFMYRQGLSPDETWVTKKIVIMGLLALPLLAIFASAYSVWREGGNLSEINAFESFISFFYDQGVTSNVMKRAYMYKEWLPSDQVYTLEFLHSGILARLLGITVYHGNTVEHALYGGSFTHSLGYFVLGNTYLAGRGTGSCYIAELYQDMGYAGVFLGSILYAYLFTRIANRKKDEKIFRTSIRFMLITQLLWAPRGSFSGFISQNLTPTTLATLVFVFGVTRMLSSVRSKSGMVKEGVR